MPPLIPVKDSLETLWLHKNLIVAIKDTYFNGFKRMISIDLHSNYLNVCPNVSFLAKQLKSLWLAHNKISSLKPFLTSTGFTQLLHLDVSYNEIYMLNLEMISHWPALRYFHINGNLLTSLRNIRDYARGIALMVGYV